MRITSSVTALSWIPSEAISGPAKLPFEVGAVHYDDPPPDVIDATSLESLSKEDRFRTANHLGGWIEVEDGRITAHGQTGRHVLNNTTMRLGKHDIVFQSAPFPRLIPAAVVTATSVRFEQTAGCRPGMPAPRRIKSSPFVQLHAPTMWTTLALTLHTDGSVERSLAGASPFPRHWVYDDSGALVEKSSLIEFDEWYSRPVGTRHTPWGDEDSPVFVIAAESALERAMSLAIMRSGAKPEVRPVPKDGVVVKQGEPGDEVLLILDGVVSVEVDGTPVAELGPGAVVGERAVLEGSKRTATLRALTPVKVAVAARDALDHEALRELSRSHHREET